MSEKNRFSLLRKQKDKFSLQLRLSVLVGATILVSLCVALGVTTLLNSFISFFNGIPPFILLCVISLIVSMIAAFFLSKLFFTPLKTLRNGMQQIYEGDYTIRLTTKTSSLEMQELFSGFNMMAQELASTEIIQSDFISNVSHEFKTPINAIEGYATLLQSSDETDATNSEYIEKILSNTKRLSSLVNNVLLLSKIENQQIQPHRETYDVTEQIRETIVSLEPSWSPKNVEFDVDMDEVEYYGTESMMHHVWTNLLGNAIKFSPDGGEIKISLHKNQSDVVFSIADNGPGLSEQAKKHLFDKFYQEDTSHKAEGNGLGLALVKRILALSDGEITAENRPEGGCLFTVVLHVQPTPRHV